MGVESFIADFKGKLDGAREGGSLLETIASGIAGYFSVRTHEIGLFTVNSARHDISFVWPPGMVNAGHIPLNAVNSLVARTANELTPTLDNSFATSRHLFMFEFMLAEKSDRIPIQKIMSVPVIVAGEAWGVIQVVHKGASPADAGNDFSGQDLADLVKIADLVSLYPLQSP